MTNGLLKRANHCILNIDERISHIQFLTGNSLKVIAVLSMVVDHLCKIIFQWLLSNHWGVMVDNGQMSWEQFQKIDNFIRFDLQSIGTIAFPLFCFLLAEGFQHTKNKKRYVGLMFIFALISEIPFDIGFFSQYSQMEGTFPFYLKYQNVFFTLFLGLLTLVCLERLSCKSEVRTDKIKSAILQVICVATLALVAELIRCDYGMQGILFIVAFYICRNHRIYQVLLFLLAYMGATGNQPPLFTILACLLILLYNGKRGKLKLKYFFYVFYPAHIFILYLIQIWIAFGLHLQWTAILSGYLLPLVFSAFIGVAGCIANLLFPNFDWENATYIVKRSIPAILNALISMALSCGGFYILIKHFPKHLFIGNAVIILIVVGLTAAAILWLKEKGEILYRKL